MVSLGIATGFERRYGVLKRLGSTPLSRGGLLAAKTVERARDRGRCRPSLIIAHRASRSAGSPTGGHRARASVLLLDRHGRVRRHRHAHGRARCGPRRTSPRRTACSSCCCSSAAWRTRSTGCPTCSRSSPRLLPAAALVRVRARRARQPGVDVPGRRASSCSLVWAVGAPLARRPLLPLGGVSRPASESLEACGGEDLAAISGVEVARRTVRRSSAATIVPSRSMKNVCGMRAHAVGRRDRIAVAAVGERPVRAARRLANARASVGMSR